MSCILGAYLGDAMGSYTEFKDINPNNHLKIFKGNNTFGDTQGHVTDDSEMAMSLSSAIIDNIKDKELDSNIIYFYYGLWYNSEPCDIGNTIYNALKLFNSDININISFSDNIKKEIEDVNADSLANGSLMRNSPFCVWMYYIYYNELKDYFNDYNNTDNLYNIYNLIKKHAVFDCIVTHPSKEVLCGYSLLCFITLCALFNYTSDVIYQIIKTLLSNNNFDLNEEKEVKDKVLSYMNQFEDANFNKNDYLKEFYKVNIGAYYKAIKMIIYYLYNFNNYSSFENIIFEICDCGGDTDTNAAIVGCALGPLFGLKSFGDSNLNILLSNIEEERFMYNNNLVWCFVMFLKDKVWVNNNNKFRFFTLLLNLLNIEL